MWLYLSSFIPLDRTSQSELKPINVSLVEHNVGLQISDNSVIHTPHMHEQAIICTIEQVFTHLRSVNLLHTS